jgi:hypothetical protein
MKLKNGLADQNEQLQQNPASSDGRKMATGI